MMAMKARACFLRLGVRKNTTFDRNFWERKILQVVLVQHGVVCIMNIDAAIRAHSDWKMKLARYLRHPDRSLSATEVSRDTVCELGCWLHGEGRKLQHLPEYQTLKAAHLAFHRAAGDIVRRADAGEKMTEAVALGSSSAYTQASGEVTMSLLALRPKIAA
jgi:methyl-accepting chemotaxis protein